MDIEKTMQFILETQAKLEVSAQRHDEQIAENARQIQASTGMIRQLVDVSLSLARHGEETDRRIRDLSDAIRDLSDAQARTDYKLAALIDTVDKLVRRNGTTQ